MTKKNAPRGKPFRRGGDKRRAQGKPFAAGPDPRRNTKGRMPEVSEVRAALQRDGLLYVDALFRAAMAGEVPAIKVALEQILGRPPQAIELTGRGGGAIEVKDARERLIERVEKLLGQPAVSLGAGATAPPAAGLKT